MNLEPRERKILECSMTKLDLLDMLDDFADEAIVLFVADYGDRCHTMQAIPIESVQGKTTADLYTTAYSHSEMAVDMDREWSEPEDADDIPVIVFS